jgi:hypothetical protein
MLWLRKTEENRGKQHQSVVILGVETTMWVPDTLDYSQTCNIA